MKSLFLGSVVERSGKSMVALGLAKNYPRRVGYFKPFKEVVMSMQDNVVDQDAYLMHQALKLPFGPEALSPFAYDIFEPVSMASILEEYRKLSAGADLMLVEGTRDITTGCMGSVSGMAIAQKVGAEVVLVSSAQMSALDKICMLRSYMDQYPLSFRGVILNQTEDDRMSRLLERRGVKVLGAIPPLKELKRFRVQEVADVVSAEVLVGGAGLDDPVERVMVGAMTPETALEQMRRVSRKAIITGGDRTDIQLAALSTDTSCLVLTGGLYPPRAVVNRASEAGVPILVTAQNTLEAAEAVDHLIARIDPQDQGKLDLIARTVKEKVDLDAVYGEV